MVCRIPYLQKIILQKPNLQIGIFLNVSKYYYFQKHNRWDTSKFSKTLLKFVDTDI